MSTRALQSSLTSELRKFTDDDVKAAVRLLDLLENDVDACIRLLERASKDRDPQLLLTVVCRDVLERFDYDVASANTLLIVTDSFRGMLGVKPAAE